MTYYLHPTELELGMIVNLEKTMYEKDTKFGTNDLTKKLCPVLLELDKGTLDFIVSHFEDETYWDSPDALHKLEGSDGKWIKYFKSIDCMSLVTGQVAKAVQELDAPKQKDQAPSANK